MKTEHKIIFDEIEKYLNDHPDQRFGQALFNLNINQFVNDHNPAKSNHLLRNIYEDSNQEILQRIESFTKKDTNTEESSNEKLRIALQFALAKEDEDELDSLLTNELCEEEKMEIIMAFDEDRIKSVLFNLGFDDEFIDSLENE